MDIDRDESISFDEFYEWWIHGKQNKLTELLRLKMKSLKLQRKFSGYVDKKFGVLPTAEPAHQKREINFNIQIGSDELKSEIQVLFESGQYHLKTVQDIFSNLSTESDEPFIVL